MTDDPSTGCPHLTPWSFLTGTHRNSSLGTKRGSHDFFPGATWSSPRSHSGWRCHTRSPSLPRPPLNTAPRAQPAWTRDTPGGTLTTLPLGSHQDGPQPGACCLTSHVLPGTGCRRHLDSRTSGGCCPGETWVLPPARRSAPTFCAARTSGIRAPQTHTHTHTHAHTCPGTRACPTGHWAEASAPAGQVSPWCQPGGPRPVQTPPHCGLPRRLPRLVCP